MACHEIAALRLGLMQVLGRNNEAERQHELAELGGGAEAPGPIRSLCEAARPGQPAALRSPPPSPSSSTKVPATAPATTRSCPTTARWWC